MKKVLSLLFALLMIANVSALAYSPFEVTEAIFKGDASISYPTLPEEGEMELSAEGETFEEVVLAGWDKFSEKIDVEKFKIKEAELLNLYSRVSYDNPLYYYIGNQFSYWYDVDWRTGQRYITDICPTYTTTDRSEVESVWKQIEDETNNILLNIDSDMTDFEKVMAVHDYMVLNYDYDYTYENHSITIMITKLGVCESYANAFNYVMSVVGIESVFVASDAMVHAWNLVKVDGKWYHIDVTWDDTARPDQVGHQFELLSDERIQSMDNPHYGYDTGGRVADSDIYDNADWHNTSAQVVSVNGVDYWVSGGNLVDGEGNIIYENLAGADGRWGIGDGYSFTNAIYAGLAVFSRMVYFNTDTGIYCYSPKTKEIKLIEEEVGICGIYIDKNILRYCKFNRLSSEFYEAGNLTLNGIRYAIPYVKNDKVFAEVFNSGTKNVKLFTFGINGCESFEVEEGLNTFELDAEEGKYMFIWDSTLRPLKNKIKLP